MGGPAPASSTRCRPRPASPRPAPPRSHARPRPQSHAQPRPPLSSGQALPLDHTDSMPHRREDSALPLGAPCLGTSHQLPGPLVSTSRRQRWPLPCHRPGQPRNETEPWIWEHPVKRKVQGPQEERRSGPAGLSRPSCSPLGHQTPGVLWGRMPGPTCAAGNCAGS